MADPIPIPGANANPPTAPETVPVVGPVNVPTAPGTVPVATPASVPLPAGFTPEQAQQLLDLLNNPVAGPRVDTYANLSGVNAYTPAEDEIVYIKQPVDQANPLFVIGRNNQQVQFLPWGGVDADPFLERAAGAVSGDAFTYNILSNASNIAINIDTAVNTGPFNPNATHISELGSVVGEDITFVIQQASNSLSPFRGEIEMSFAFPPGFPQSNIKVRHGLYISDIFGPNFLRTRFRYQGVFHDQLLLDGSTQSSPTYVRGFYIYLNGPDNKETIFEVTQAENANFTNIV